MDNKYNEGLKASLRLCATKLKKQGYGETEIRIGDFLAGCILNGIRHHADINDIEVSGVLDCVLAFLETVNVRSDQEADRLAGQRGQSGRN